MPRASCILTSFNCVRLGWAFDSDADDHRALALVDAARILWADDIQTDNRDLSDRPSFTQRRRRSRTRSQSGA